MGKNGWEICEEWRCSTGRVSALYEVSPRVVEE